MIVLNLVCRYIPKGKEAEREGQTSSLVLSAVTAAHTRAIYLHILFVIILSPPFSLICHFGGPTLRNPAFWLHWVKSSSRAWLSNGKETGRKLNISHLQTNSRWKLKTNWKPFGHKDSVMTESVYDMMKGCCCLQCSRHFACISNLFWSVLALESNGGFCKHKHHIIPLLNSVSVSIPLAECICNIVTVSIIYMIVRLTAY